MKKLISIAIAILMVSMASVALFGCGDNASLGRDNNDFWDNYHSRNDSTYTNDYNVTHNDDINSETDSPQINDNSSHEENNNATTNPPTTGSIERVVLNPELQRIVDSAVTLSASSNREFQNFLRTIQVDFRYSEYFNIDEAWERYNALPSLSITSSAFINNGILNTETLRNRILSNNSEFMAGRIGGRYAEFTDEKFNFFFDIFAEVLQNKLSIGAVYNVDHLDDNLKGLRILHTNDRFVGGYVTTDNIMAFSLNTLESRQNNYDFDLFRFIAIHEAIHYVQKVNIEKIAISGNYLYFNFGFSRAWEDIEVNPFELRWFIEGATDHLVMAFYETNLHPTVYAEKVRALDMFIMATLLQPNVTPLSLVSLSLQPSFSPLFDIFNADTETRQRELLNMMFALELAIVGDRHFFSAIGSSEMTGGLPYHFWTRGRTSELLSREFYSNLSNRITNEETSIESIFSVISTFETGLNRLTRYRTNDRLNANRNFLEVYSSIQNEFFTLLSNELGISVDYIQRSFNAFHSAVSLNALCFSILDEEERQFFELKALQLDRERTNSVNLVFNSLN